MTHKNLQRKVAAIVAIVAINPLEPGHRAMLRESPRVATVCDSCDSFTQQQGQPLLFSNGREDYCSGERMRLTDYSSAGNKSRVVWPGGINKGRR